MTFTFGPSSLAKLSTCHPDLLGIAAKALSLSPVDFTIVYGWRGEAEQNLLVSRGLSKTPWPTSKHNNMQGTQPYSLAFDFAPWVNNTIPWNDTHLFSFIAGVIHVAARIAFPDVPRKIRWGGDWNGDGSTTDQKFMDWGHIELYDPATQTDG